MFKFFKSLFTKKFKTGPATLAELLNQVHGPSQLEYKPEHDTLKLKTQIMFHQIELDHLVTQPMMKFTGSWKADMGDGTVVLDWVPVMILPEALYCYAGNN
jgi:hypothetical protein